MLARLVLARFSLAAALAGALAIVTLGIGRSGFAAPAAPPIAPIFYCPTPPTSAPAPARSASARHRSKSRRSAAALARNESWREGPEGVAQSQAFVYRYERALKGLNPQAAQEAWRAGAGATPAAPPSPSASAGQTQSHEESWAYEERSQRGDLGAAPPASGYRLAGRDRFGYLTWPGKTSQNAP